MFGKLIAQSGAAQKIASVLIRKSGERFIAWALMLTGFIAGIPLFYNVGFVLLIPLVFSVAYYSKLPAIYVGLPLLAALVGHAWIPAAASVADRDGADAGRNLEHDPALRDRRRAAGHGAGRARVRAGVSPHRLKAARAVRASGHAGRAIARRVELVRDGAAAGRADRRIRRPPLAGCA